jgi:DNA polymerase-1
VQGTAADLIKMAMIRVDGALKEGGFRSRMLLQVHDELLLEVPQAELLAVQSLVVGEMRAAGERLIVPLDVTAAAGLNWNQAHG